MLSHVTILLYVILVAIFSFWTAQRVRKASSKYPFDYTTASSDYPQSPETSKKLLPGSFPFQPILKRSLSHGSHKVAFSEKQPRLSGSYGWRTPPLCQQRSFSAGASCVSDRDDVQSEAGTPTWEGQQTPELKYWLSDGDDSNSPTGSLLDDSEEGTWPASAADILRKRATSGRKILTAIGLLRAILGVPALLHYSKLGFSSVSVPVYVYSANGSLTYSIPNDRYRKRFSPISTCSSVTLPYQPG